MTEYIKNEIQIINIFIGFSIRLERLKNNLSQHDVAIKCGTISTSIGRIERGEHFSSWATIYLASRCMGIDFESLFKLKTKEELLALVEECHSLETKLTKSKESYYNSLRRRIENLFIKDN